MFGIRISKAKYFQSHNKRGKKEVNEQNSVNLEIMANDKKVNRDFRPKTGNDLKTVQCSHPVQCVIQALSSTLL